MMNPPMPMRMWTERDAADDTNPYAAEAWQAKLANEPCYWWVAGGDETVSESRQATVSDEHVICGHSIDVAEGDRVIKVVDHEARTVFDTTASDAFREVDHVVHHRDFYELILSRAG